MNNRDRVRVRTEMAKAKSFSSRSEAGRYAANMRWKGQGEKNMATGSTPTSSKAPALVDRLRDIVDNNVNDNGDSIDDLNKRYWEGDEYIPFEDLPQGGFREQVIAAFIDAKAAGYYDEPGRLRGPYDRPSNKMTDKGYAKARAHALKGNRDNSPSDLDEYWDDNSSVFWDEYAMITDQYPKDE